MQRHAQITPAVWRAHARSIPSGEILTGETNERGVAMFELPIDAPLTGVVTARADGVAAVAIRY